MSFQFDVLELARWTVLLYLYHADHRAGICEKFLPRLFQDARLTVSPAEAKNILFYLEDLELCKLEKDTFDQCWARITPKGIQVVEYQIECPPGIAREEKRWW